MGLRRIPLDQIIPNPDQPRKQFDEQALRDLAGSIRARGLKQPIAVRPIGAGSLPPGRCMVQLAAPNDPPPSGRFAVERVARHNADDPVQAEFAICSHIDSLKRELRTNDRVHAMQRYRGAIRNMLRRVEAKGDSLLLYPMRRARGPKAKPINAADVAIMGVVLGTFTQFRV